VFVMKCSQRMPRLSPASNGKARARPSARGPVPLKA
jgi:hypothetical protein